MTALTSNLKDLRSILSHGPSVVAGAGLLATVLTPFVFFPEIMGDAGVTHASTLRNGTALAFLILSALVTLIGLISFGGQLMKKQRGKKVARR